MVIPLREDENEDDEMKKQLCTMVPKDMKNCKMREMNDIEQNTND